MLIMLLSVYHIAYRMIAALVPKQTMHVMSHGIIIYASICVASKSWDVIVATRNWDQHCYKLSVEDC
jgi:hypothetical protein